MEYQLYQIYCTDSIHDWEYLSYHDFKFQVGLMCESFDCVLGILKKENKNKIIEEIMPILYKKLDEISEEYNNRAIAKTIEKGRLTRKQEKAENELKLIKKSKKQAIIDFLHNKNSQGMISMEMRWQLRYAMRDRYATFRLLNYKRLLKRKSAKDPDYLLTDLQFENIINKIDWVEIA